MIKPIYTRKETISVEKVRTMCIANNFYTRGDVRAYEMMFRKCAQYSGKIEELQAIAGDIFDHSDYDEMLDYGFDTIYEAIAWIMRLIIMDCMFTEVKVEEVEE